MIPPYHVKIAPKAERQIKEFSIKSRKHIFKLLEALSINPRPIDSKKIAGMTGLYREHSNQLHIIYKIEDQEILLLVVK